MTYKKIALIALLIGLSNSGNAQAATISFNSSGDDGAIASGWFSFDENSLLVPFVLQSDLTDFYWDITGNGGSGISAGTTGTPLTLGDLSYFEASYITDGFTTSLTFGTTDLAFTEQPGSYFVYNDSFGVTFTNNAIASVPLPPTAWLYCSALLGYYFMGRGRLKRKR